MKYQLQNTLADTPTTPLLVLRCFQKDSQSCGPPLRSSTAIFYAPLCSSPVLEHAATSTLFPFLPTPRKLGQVGARSHTASSSFPWKRSVCVCGVGGVSPKETGLRQGSQAARLLRYSGWDCQGRNWSLVETLSWNLLCGHIYIWGQRGRPKRQLISKKKL